MAVFQPQRYFSQPIDFHRERIPWDPRQDSKRLGQNGFQKRKGSSVGDVSNPFRQIEVGIQCNG